MCLTKNYFASFPKVQKQRLKSMFRETYDEEFSFRTILVELHTQAILIDQCQFREWEKLEKKMTAL